MHLAFEAGGSVLAHGTVVQDVNDVAERLALAKQGAPGFDAVGIRRRHQDFESRAVQILETSGPRQHGHRGRGGGYVTWRFGFCCDEEVGHDWLPLGEVKWTFWARLNSAGKLHERRGECKRRGRHRSGRAYIGIGRSFGRSRGDRPVAPTALICIVPFFVERLVDAY